MLASMCSMCALDYDYKYKQSWGKRLQSYAGKPAAAKPPEG